MTLEAPRPIARIFISTGNAARSPMAEAILRRFGRDRFEVVSAGVTPRPIEVVATDAERSAAYDRALTEITSRIHRFIPTAVAEAA